MSSYIQQISLARVKGILEGFKNMSGTASLKRPQQKRENNYADSIECCDGKRSRLDGPTPSIPTLTNSDKKALRRHTKLVRNTMKRLIKNNELSEVVDIFARGDWSGIYHLLEKFTPTAVLEQCKNQEHPQLRNLLTPEMGLSYNGADSGIYLRCMKMSLQNMKKRMRALEEGVDVSDEELESQRLMALKLSLAKSIELADDLSLPSDTTMYRYYTGQTETSFDRRMEGHRSSARQYLGGSYAEERLESQYHTFTFYGMRALHEAAALVFHVHKGEPVTRYQFQEILKVAENLVAALIGSYWHQGSSNLACCGHEYDGVNNCIRKSQPQEPAISEALTAMTAQFLSLHWSGWKEDDANPSLSGIPIE